MILLLIILFCLFCIMLIVQLVFVNQLQRQSFSDYETKLYNYRWFTKKLNSLNKKNNGQSTPIPLTIAILDIDDFRRFNKIGIRVGDEVLQAFAKQLSEYTFELSATKNIVRYRLGDEFAIIFENRDNEYVEDIMKKILSFFEQSHLKIESSTDPIYLSFSYGFAQLNLHEGIDSLMCRAENMLMLMKSNK